MEDIKCPLLRDMLKGLLDPDPEHRLSINEALCHPFCEQLSKPPGLCLVLHPVIVFPWHIQGGIHHLFLGTSGQSLATDNR